MCLYVRISSTELQYHVINEQRLEKVLYSSVSINNLIW